MVGGLADWFAVTALFRHPLGLPIPHTAIIPENKDRIAETMAQFLRENFLTPQVVARRLSNMNLAAAAGDWLADPAKGGSTRLRDGAAELLAQVLESLDPERLGSQVRGGLFRQLEKLEVSPLIGQMLSTMIADRRHLPVMDSLVRWTGLTLEDNEDLIRDLIHRRANAVLRWTGLDERLATSVIDGLYKLLAETLHTRTSKLPEVKIEKPKDVIGNSTESSIRSGVFYGYLGMIEGILSRTVSQLRQRPKVVATGGFAQLVAANITGIDQINENLTLEGLRLLMEYR